MSLMSLSLLTSALQAELHSMTDHREQRLRQVRTLRVAISVAVVILGIVGLLVNGSNDVFADIYPDQHFNWTVTATGTETYDEPMRGEDDPASQGLYELDGTSYKDGRAVTQFGVTAF